MNWRNSRNSILYGYRALDLADEKGAFCSRLLADMGAEVIRVEKPGERSGRSLRPVETDIGKLGITLDIEVEPGREIFRRLVKAADVVVESYQPGYLETLGLGYAELKRLNPRLVMASVTGFGQSGPYRDYKSCDLVSSAMGGWMYVCGEPETPPIKPFGHQSYYTAGLFAAIGVLLALWGRHTSGTGQYVDISLQECVAATLDHVLVRYLYEEVVAERWGGLYWNSAFRVFPCRDGYILLSLFQQWPTLVEWLDSEGMADDLTDKRWADREERIRHIDHIIAVLERWTLSHSVGELVEKGQLMRFPWAAVNTVPELLAIPQLRERSFWVEVERPGSGKGYKYPGPPCKMSRSPWRVGKRAPEAGEHNNEIYRGEMGLSEAQTEALLQEGVI